MTRLGFEKPRTERYDHNGDRRSVFGLFRELRDEARLLLHQEVALAKAEVSEKVQGTVRDTMTIAVGGVVLLLGSIFLLRAASEGLLVGLIAIDVAADIASWLAPLIVGAVVTFIGAIMLLTAKKRIEDRTLYPEKTAKSLQEDKQWLKDKLT